MAGRFDFGFGLVALVALFVGSVCGEVIVYVDANAPGPIHDGSSWCQAYTDLQDALDSAVPETTIRVADGAYTPDRGTEDRTATFQLLDGVAIEGGYAGCGAPDPDERDIDEFETILSGDLAGDDPGGGNLSDNAYRVVTGSGTNETAILDGVTVAGGTAYGPWEEHYDEGAGLYNHGGSPTLNHCTFRDNHAEGLGGAMRNLEGANPTLTDGTFAGNMSWNSGGGMANSNSAPTLIDCSFEGNSASFSGGGIYNSAAPAVLADCTFSDNTTEGYGGGMINHGSSPALTNCTFVDNATEQSGGGMYNNDGSNPTLLECRFITNTAPGNGGGMRNYASSPNLANCTFDGNRADTHGGGMANTDSSPDLTDCLFTKNSAFSTIYDARGGGMYNSGTSSPTLARCTFESNLATFDGGAMYNDGNDDSTMSHCTLRANNAARDGGAVYTFSSNLTLTNCLLSGNAAGGDGGALFNDLSAVVVTNGSLAGNQAGSRGGGIYNYVGCEVTLTNDILWDNRDMEGNSEGAQVFSNPSNIVLVNHSCIQGWSGGLGGEGNFGNDPQLVDADGADDEYGTEDDNLRLQGGSLCIDAGDSPAVIWPVDLDSHARIVNLTVDMGAYEFQGALPAPTPHSERKNRYISFSSGGPGRNVGFRVGMTDCAYFPDSTGELGWVGEADENGVARIVEGVFFSDSWPTVVHVGDCRIVPVATYEIAATLNGVFFFEPLTAPTILQPAPKYWADVVGEFVETAWTGPNGVVNMDDVMASVQKFLHDPTAPHLTRVDVDGETPNAVLNFTDILQLVQGFKGEPYPFREPGLCLIAP